MRLEADTSHLILVAAGIAREFGHSYVGSEHLLAALSYSCGWIGQLLGSCGLNAHMARCAVAHCIGSGTPDSIGSSPFASAGKNRHSISRKTSHFLFISILLTMHILTSPSGKLSAQPTERATAPSAAQSPLHEAPDAAQG